MGYFRRIQDINESLLTQLKRIADSLEHSCQIETNEVNRAMSTQLSRIVEVLEQSGISEGNDGNQALVVQLGRIVDTLEKNCHEASENAKQEQLVQLHRIADALEKSLSPVQDTLKDNIKAAYALNLCLVSISQIIDYSDLYVLEQEYEGILNNLNLEHMPKDEALLDILRQILDTITFFRIQEGEKKFIEQKYQDSMKTAIWSAVPNCGVILTCAEPKAMLISLISQVGTGYMNYRKEKVKAGQDKERAEWELHKAAVEQFNGLRRELFTTAWKLADRYKFKDEWRLTESQISQYNRVLMDENLSRRLARLEDLESGFKAYPPFWYFKGHTAMLLANSNPEEFADMYATARSAYEKYFEINSEDDELLRNDPICSACALEYVALLGDEKQKKLKYIHRAIKSAGTKLDIIQLSAIAYLDIEETEKAAALLRRLVCEEYNEKVNAQLLSAIYIAEYLKVGVADKYRPLYNRLSTFTSEGNLIGWPNEENSMDEQYARFVSEQRAALLEDCAKFLCEYYVHSAKQFCMAIADEQDKNKREEAFVVFARQIEEEFKSFPNVGISENTFAALMQKKETAIREFVGSKKKATNKIFDEFFAIVFYAMAENISQAELETMENIMALELELSKIVGVHFLKKAEQQENRKRALEDTLTGLFRTDSNTSEKFNRIKDEVSSIKQDLIKKESKHTNLLIAGTMEYYRYIKDHGLPQEYIVAVINDKSLNDRDLLLTENGLLVHHWQSKAAKVTKSAVPVAIFGAVSGLGSVAVSASVSSIADSLYHLFNQEVSYSEVVYAKGKIKKPNYSNKDVDMEQLINLINCCKCETQNEVEDGIRSRIRGRG